MKSETSQQSMPNKVPFNLRRMDWIVRLFSTIEPEDREWVMARLASDHRKLKEQPKRKRGRSGKVRT